MSFLDTRLVALRYTDAPVGDFVYGPQGEKGMGKKIDIATLKSVVGTLYPPPFDEPCRLRQRTRLGDAAGLTQYGVNLPALASGRLVEPAALACQGG